MEEPRCALEKSRLRWVALDHAERDELFAAARAGTAWADDDTALAAVHWAWAVLGPPWARRPYPLADLVLRFAPAALFENVFNGAKQHDMRFPVRRAAKQVERTNLPRLRDLGLVEPRSGSSGLGEKESGPA